ncbi:MAG: fumarylacetoacetase [Bacteroidetes bacterium]|nr:fumarylacetoacetase [Bacteroidota bacterium]
MTRSAETPQKSWIETAPDCDFPIQNLPFGIFRTSDRSARPGIAIGDYIVDLSALFQANLLNVRGIIASVLTQPYLNDLISLGKNTTNGIRERVRDLLDENNPDVRDNLNLRERVLVRRSTAEMQVPVQIGDYTDFYSSIDHATNVGTMFRDPNNALLPNWKHLPVGYHGRASSIVVSGTPIRRPKGQQMPEGAEAPVFGPTRQLDFELEVAFVTGKSTDLGQSIPTEKAEDYIFGLLLFDDLSARDIQKWEYVPLGPFLAKNFGSVISPWIVTLEALEPFRVKGADQDPAVLPYLEFEGKKNYDIQLEVAIQPAGGNPHVVSKSNVRHLYWNMCQQLAHQTVNGCNINVGDLYASGTISGPDPGSYGSMLEIAWKGTKPVKIPGFGERKFIDDGDVIIMRGWAQGKGYRVGFGECRCEILPAIT